MSGAASLGGGLKAERIRQGADLQEISAKTKISTIILEAIENNQLASLPGGAYRRSFVRQYARALAVDEEAVMAAFSEQFEEPPLPLPTPPNITPRRRFVDFIWALAVVAVFAGVYKWSQRPAASGWPHVAVTPRSTPAPSRATAPSRGRRPSVSCSRRGTPALREA